MGSKASAVFAIIALLLLAMGADAHKHTEHEARNLFGQFIATHSKKYHTKAEHERRFAIFQENLAQIEELNAAGLGSARFGINRFTDLSNEEFTATHAMREPLKPEDMEEIRSLGIQGASSLKTDGDIPAAWDWRQANPPVVTPVKDQGDCGSCWTFSTTGAVEGAWALAGHPLVSLSEQQLVDCDLLDGRCHGGDVANAYQYIIMATGIESEADYPYLGVEATCRYSPLNISASISNYTIVPSDEKLMAEYLYNFGPMSVCYNSQHMQHYTSGIYSSKICPASGIDHAVLAVGYGSEIDPTTQENVDFWIIKNSWTDTWGEAGYFRMVRGVDMCGVATYPTQAVV